MQQNSKFLLPSPVFDKVAAVASSQHLHFLTPSGMTLLPRERQAPAMYGPRGATVPARFLPTTSPAQQQQQQRHHFNNNNKNWQQKKLTKQAPLEKRPQYCEACEMELCNQQEYRAHIAAHKPCAIIGCRYRGLAVVMEKHIAAIHSSGLFEKLKKTETPEEIAAWREERRKRYPTLANVLLRMQAKEQRQKRGERLENNKSRFGKREDRKRAYNHNENGEQVQSKRKRNNFKQKQKAKQMLQQNDAESKAVPTEIESQDACCGVLAFKGTRQLKQYHHVDNEQQQSNSNALSSLLCAYGSDSEQEQEEHVDEADNGSNVSGIFEEKEKNITVAVPPKEQQITLIDEQPNRQLQLTNEQFEADNHLELVSKTVVNSSDEAPEETSIARSCDLPLAADNKTMPAPTEASMPTTAASKTPKQMLTQPQRKALHGLDYRKAKLRKQNTMLEKLLETEIRHERNVLLQCVRFVCEQQFFGIGAAKQKE